MLDVSPWLRLRRAGDESVPFEERLLTFVDDNASVPVGRATDVQIPAPNNAFFE
jgi:hypothetical protein